MLQNPAVVVRVGGNDKDETDKDYVFPLYYSTDTGKTWTKFKPTVLSRTIKEKSLCRPMEK